MGRWEQWKMRHGTLYKMWCSEKGEKRSFRWFDYLERNKKEKFVKKGYENEIEDPMRMDGYGKGKKEKVADRGWGIEQARKDCMKRKRRLFCHGHPLKRTFGEAFSPSLEHQYHTNVAQALYTTPAKLEGTLYHKAMDSCCDVAVMEYAECVMSSGCLVTLHAWIVISWRHQPPQKKQSYQMCTLLLKKTIKSYIFTIMVSVYEIKWRLQLVQLHTFGHREHLISSKCT